MMLETNSKKKEMDVTEDFDMGMTMKSIAGGESMFESKSGNGSRKDEKPSHSEKGIGNGKTEADPVALAFAAAIQSSPLVKSNNLKSNQWIQLRFSTVSYHDHSSKTFDPSASASGFDVDAGESRELEKNAGW